MRKFVYFLPVILLTACGESNNSGITDGRFKATLGETQFETAVKCGRFDSDDAFFFNSDNGTAIKDTDGDGVIVAGSRVIMDKKESHMPMSIDGMSLEITVKGESYSAPMTMPGKKSNQTWTKTANGVTGTDKLWKEDDPTGEEFPITYEVVCI